MPTVGSGIMPIMPRGGPLVSDAEKVRRIYDKRAAKYDVRAGRSNIDALRADLFWRARGDVLEIGVGTGATFAHYPANLTSLTGLDISVEMLNIARPKAADVPFPVTLQVVDFQNLPFPRILWFLCIL